MVKEEGHIHSRRQREKGMRAKQREQQMEEEGRSCCSTAHQVLW